MFDVDPARIRELAGQVREKSAAVMSKTSVAVPARDQARAGAKESLALTRTEETLKALDSVLKFHAARMTGLADVLDQAATDFEAQDLHRAGQFDQIEPR